VGCECLHPGAPLTILATPPTPAHNTHACTHAGAHDPPGAAGGCWPGAGIRALSGAGRARRWWRPAKSLPPLAALVCALVLLVPGQAALTCCCAWVLHVGRKSRWGREAAKVGGEQRASMQREGTCSSPDLLALHEANGSLTLAHPTGWRWRHAGVHARAGTARHAGR